MDTNRVGYEVETTSYQVGATTYRLRTLRDRKQFSDPDGCAERAGISSTSWPMFGVLWPVGLALAEAFLRHNTELNGLAPIPFFKAPWLAPSLELGRFDLIIGSDLLYERNHPSLLANFLADHANPTCQILLADPGRGRGGQLSVKLALHGYLCTKTPLEAGIPHRPLHRGRLLNFIRTHSPAALIP